MKLIESWEQFEEGEIQYFNIDEHNSLRRAWEAYLAGIKKNVNELKFLRRSLQHRIESFDSMRTRVRKAFQLGKDELNRSARQCFFDGGESSHRPTRHEHRSSYEGYSGTLMKNPYF